MLTYLSLYLKSCRLASHLILATPAPGILILATPASGILILATPALGILILQYTRKVLTGPTQNQ